jgi:hypothetical protein
MKLWSLIELKSEDAEPTPQFVPAQFVLAEPSDELTDPETAYEPQFARD